MKVANTIPGMRRRNLASHEDVRNSVRWFPVPKHPFKKEK
jgi:hypothetical protein